MNKTQAITGDQARQTGLFCKAKGTSFSGWPLTIQWLVESFLNTIHHIGHFAFFLGYEVDLSKIRGSWIYFLLTRFELHIPPRQEQLRAWPACWFGAWQPPPEELQSKVLEWCSSHAAFLLDEMYHLQIGWSRKGHRARSGGTTRMLESRICSWKRTTSSICHCWFRDFITYVETLNSPLGTVFMSGSG